MNIEKLTREQIEDWRENFQNLCAPSCNPKYRAADIDALCDLAISALAQPAPLQEREKFEQWLERKYPRIGAPARRPDGSYLVGVVENMWTAFQAARS